MGGIFDVVEDDDLDLLLAVLPGLDNLLHLGGVAGEDQGSARIGEDVGDLMWRQGRVDRDVLDPHAQACVVRDGPFGSILREDRRPPAAVHPQLHEPPRCGTHLAERLVVRHLEEPVALEPAECGC